MVALGKHWKRFLGIIGIPTALDFVKEILRTKVGDWMFEKLSELGNIGKWIAAYPFALGTIGLVAAIGWLVVAGIRESETYDESAILDLEGNPYQKPRVSKALSRGIAAVAVICIAFIGYGAYFYYRTVPLLDQYPLGYVIFDTDYVTSAVTPLETRRGLEAYQFDFRKVQIVENTASRIAIQLPDVIKNQTPLLTNARIGGDKITMQRFGAGYMFSDGPDMIMAVGQVQKYEGPKIIWILGFSREPTLQPAPSQ